MPAVLGLAALGLELARVGLEPEVAALDVHRLARLERADRAAAVAVGPVDPAVEAELEAVEPVLLVALGEPGEEDLAMVGLAVAVAILGVEDVGRRGDEHAVPPGHEAGGKRQAVEERRRLVVAAVAVRVLEEPDHAAGLALAVDAQGIVAHLDDPELAVGAPVQRDRVLDQGLAGGQLDLEPRRDADRVERGLGRFRLPRHVLQQVVERAAIDVVGKLGGVFVLPPEMAGVDEEAVVRAVPDDLRQGPGLAGLAGHDLAGPALVAGSKRKMP